MPTRWTTAIVAATVFIGAAVALAGDADDVKDVPAKEVKLGEKQRYFLIGKTGGDGEKGLLLVLPGGAGGADFQPFVKRIEQNALPDDFLIAELVAVDSKNPNQVVWPTAKSKDPKQNFTTEEFIRKVVADAKTHAKIDDKRVFALGWSSSGPALYAASTDKDTPVKGWFVAMSVFFPGQMGDLTATKGQKFYLLHSPQDQVCKYTFAKNAEARLKKAGAEVKLTDYEGGHGWHGDVFGNIREGVDWLAK